MAIVGAEFCDPEERVLTVRKTSHFSPGDGFAAYDHRTGGLAFRADTYGRGHGGGAASAGELVLLGRAGSRSSPCAAAACRCTSTGRASWAPVLTARSRSSRPAGHPSSAAP